MTLDGKLLAPGNTGYGPRAGGGAGGSVWIQTGEFYGSGSIDVTGGSVGTEDDIVQGQSVASCKFALVCGNIRAAIWKKGPSNMCTLRRFSSS